MREIKFRAWDLKLENWTNYQIGVFDDSVRFYDKCLGTWHNANDRFEFMQYTGLKDMNGKDIYEDDLVYLYDANFGEEGGVFKVEWDNKTAKLVLTLETLQADFDNFYSYEIEIVGNKFENPELLEVQKK